jgi:hypothetical protein
MLRGKKETQEGKSEKSSSEKEESHKEEVRSLYKLGAKTEITRAAVMRPLFFVKISQSAWKSTFHPTRSGLC